MKRSFPWKEYLSDEWIPDTEDSLGFIDAPPPVYFPFSMSEALTAASQESWLGASEVEHEGELRCDESPSPPLRPTIYRRPCPARLRKYETPSLPLSFTQSPDLGQYTDLLCYESWASVFLSEETPRSDAKSKDLAAKSWVKSEETGAKTEELGGKSDEWWLTASEGHRRLLATLLPELFWVRSSMFLVNLCLFENVILWLYARDLGV